MEFGRKKRKPASTHHIAEIISHFDLVAVTELRENTGDLERIMKVLGPYWSVIHSDATMDAGGNGERIGYLYDKRVITFTGLAAEADPIRRKVKGEYVPTMTWWRSPYMASFRAGRFDFVVLSAHIRWSNTPDRKEALRKLAEWIDKRRKSKHVKDKDIIVMGDFNIPNVRGELWEEMTCKGLVAPKEILGTHGTNLARDKRYDQILFYPEQAQRVTCGGAVDFYKNDIESRIPGADTRWTSADTRMRCQTIFRSGFSWTCGMTMRRSKNSSGADEVPDKRCRGCPDSAGDRIVGSTGRQTPAPCLSSGSRFLTIILLPNPATGRPAAF